MSTQLMMHGDLFDGGQPCQGFRSDSGDVFGLVGSIVDCKNGDKVYVVGSTVEGNISGYPKTLLVSWIGKQLSSGVVQPVKRDVEVTATYSSHDNSPELKLEGRAQSLTYDNIRGKWFGRYVDFEITPPLNILFVSEGWSGQTFEVKIDVTDSATGKIKSETFKKPTKKGVVVIEGDMGV